MAKDHTQLKPFEPISPGDILREELEARDWTQQEFSEIIDRPLKTVNEIIQGKKAITPETAKLFGAALGTSAQLWLNLESNYRLHSADIQRKEESASRRAYIYSLVPVSEMMNRGWISRTKSASSMENAIREFFGVTELSALKPAISGLRVGRGRSVAKGSIYAWLRRVEIAASDSDSPPYSAARLGKTIESIVNYSRDDVDGPRWAIEHLQSIGVPIVLLKHLKKTYIDGAAIFSSPQPIVGLSLRIKRIDNFWFTLVHELGHILLHQERLLNQAIIDSEKDNWLKSSSGDEHEANTFARNALIPPDKYRDFIRACSGFYSEVRIRDFASSLGISPAIVVGRLQWEKKINYSSFRKLLVSVNLAPSE